MSYHRLVADIVRYAEDNGDKFMEAMPTIISNGLRTLSRTLSLELYNRDTVFALTPDMPVIEFDSINDKPKPVVVDYLVTAGGDFIERRSMAYLRAHGGRGMPKYFADISDKAIMICPTPVSSVVVTMTYLTLPDLSPTEPANWYTENVYDLLFNTCMGEAERFLLAPEEAAIYEANAARLLVEARRDHADQLRRVYQPLAVSAMPKEKTVAS